MNHFFYRLSLLSFLSCMICLQAQAQFFLNGSAVANDSCFQLTTTENWQVGSIWNGEKINLNESFVVSANLFLGCKDDDGADGLVFGLQPVSTSIGVGGGDLGFGNVEPSLGVEFDTHQNIDYDDPTFDHIAIIRDGNVRHNNTPSTTLAGPVQANLNDPNIEDCQYHTVRIAWDAAMQTLSVHLDCELRLNYTGDIVNEILDGDPFVFWGFTAATGGLDNIQEVCLSYTSFLNSTADQTICPGNTVQLEASGGTSYQWSPAIGLSDPNVANPIASPEETTLYTVEIPGDCGTPIYDEVLITVDNNPFDLDIISFPNNLTTISLCSKMAVIAAIDTTIGKNYTYTWSSAIGSTFSDPDSSHTEVTSSAYRTGTETLAVMVSADDGCTETDSIRFEITGSIYDIPNVFTPNGDNINDTFGAITKEEVEIAVYNCKIFNRWGELVYETDNHAVPWDGTSKGKAVPSDVYLYLIKMEIAGVPFEEKGDVTLMR